MKISPLGPSALISLFLHSVQFGVLVLVPITARSLLVAKQGQCHWVWPLRVPGRRCFWVLSTDTKQWRWARREGWEGGGGRLGLYQDTESPGAQCIFYWLIIIYLVSNFILFFLSPSDIRCLFKLDAPFQNSDDTQERYRLGNGNSELPNTMTVWCSWYLHTTFNITHMDPSLLVLASTWYSQHFKTFVHWTGKKMKYRLLVWFAFVWTLACLLALSETFILLGRLWREVRFSHSLDSLLLFGA